VYHHANLIGTALIPRNPTHLQRYAVAIGAVAIAFTVRYGLYGTLDHRLPFSFFIPATLIAAWFGGLGPGLLAATAGLLLGDYFFLPPHEAGSQMSEAARTGIGLYAMNTALIVLLFWHLHSRLQEREDELRKMRGEAPRHRHDITATPTTPPGR
jgi:K+-sensing histidine kinase KdpD